MRSVFVPAWNNGELDMALPCGQCFTIPKGRKQISRGMLNEKKTRLPQEKRRMNGQGSASASVLRPRRRKRAKQKKAARRRDAKCARRVERLFRFRGEQKEGEDDDSDEKKSVASDETSASGDSAGTSRSSESSGSSGSSESSSESDSSDESTAFDEDTEVWEQTWNDGQGQFEYRRINPETNTVFPPDTKGGLGQMLLYDPLHAEECREEAENAFQSYDVDGTGQLNGKKSRSCWRVNSVRR